MKLIKMLSFAALVLGCAAKFSVVLHAATEFGLIVNGETSTFEADAEPINIDGRLLFPLRNVFNAINDGSGSIEWDADDRMVSISLRGKEVLLWIDNPEAKINGETLYVLDHVKPIIYNDRTYLPLRFIAEQFDMIVGWNDEHSIASVVDREVYETVRALLMESESIAGRMSKDVSVIQVSSNFTNSGSEVSHSTIDGSFNIDLDNEFLYMIATTSTSNSPIFEDGTRALELYMLGDESFVYYTDFEGWVVSSNIFGFLFSMSLGITPPRMMSYIRYADLEAIAEELDVDPYLTLGLSGTADDNTIISGVLLLPASEVIIPTEDQARYSLLYPIYVKYALSQETGNIISMDVEYTRTKREPFGPLMMTDEVTVRVYNIDIDPGFESVVPDSVRMVAKSP